jgi:hypothetical protein
MLLNMSNVTEGKMFGYPAYYVNKKLFACIYGEGVGVKVPEKIVPKFLSDESIIPFQPYGKSKMKKWIQINHVNSEDYHKDMDIFRISVEFVSQLKIPKRKKI